MALLCGVFIYDQFLVGANSHKTLGITVFMPY